MTDAQKNNNSCAPLHYDIIIVGQGIAGSLLAWELIQRKQRVLVVDNHHIGSSSTVAAGIINPITGHRINLTSDFSHLLQHAKSTYTQLHETFGQEFISLIPQARLIKNLGQKSYYQKRLKQKEYSPFLEPLITSHTDLKQNGLGVANIHQSYRVHVKPLLVELKKWLQQRGAMLEKSLKYDDISITHNLVTLSDSSKHITARSIIFCEGHQAIHNPWLQDLPFKLAKGEILTVKTAKPVNTLLNWGNWLLPIDENSAYLGASYQWHDSSLDVNQQVSDSLMNNLEEFTHIDASVIEHQAGIRPTTINRKLFIGQHPKHQNLYCFNGFGSKGCLTIPYYAKTLAQHFVDGSALKNTMPELDSGLGLSLE